jgi:hypothetical protein
VKHVNTETMLEGNVETETGHLAFIVSVGGTADDVRVWIQATEDRGTPQLTATVDAEAFIELAAWALTKLHAGSGVAVFTQSADDQRRWAPIYHAWEEEEDFDDDM